MSWEGTDIILLDPLTLLSKTHVDQGKFLLSPIKIWRVMRYRWGQMGGFGVRNAILIWGLWQKEIKNSFNFWYSGWSVNWPCPHCLRTCQECTAKIWAPPWNYSAENAFSQDFLLPPMILRLFTIYEALHRTTCSQLNFACESPGVKKCWCLGPSSHGSDLIGMENSLNTGFHELK